MAYSNSAMIPHGVCKSDGAIAGAAINAVTTTTTSAAIDVSNCYNKTLICTGTLTSGNGAFTVQLSPDGSNWHTTDRLIDTTGCDTPVASVSITVTATTKVAQIPDYAIYMRVICTVTTDGTYTGVVMAG